MNCKWLLRACLACAGALAMSRYNYGSLLYKLLTCLDTGVDAPAGADKNRPSNLHCVPCPASDTLRVREESTQGSTGVIKSHLF